MKLLLSPTHLTCSLEIGDWKPVQGVQKIIGFSRGWHHWNSIRLGYNRSENTNFVRLFLYTYVKGKRNEQLIGTWQVGTKLDVELTFKHHVFAATVRVDFFGQYSKVQYAPIWFPIGVLLRPYMEEDGEENKVIPFSPKISDLRINGREIEL
jgi:hypothetical protein